MEEKIRVNPRVTTTVDINLHGKMLNYGFSPSECMELGIQKKIEIVELNNLVECWVGTEVYMIPPPVKTKIDVLVAKIAELSQKIAELESKILIKEAIV